MPRTKIQSNSPNTRATKFSAGSLVTGVLNVGNPLGLLLSLTYAAQKDITEDLTGQKPRSSVSKFEAGTLVTELIPAGTSLGLLLSLTRGSATTSTENLTGQKPNTSIIND